MVNGHVERLQKLMYINSSERIMTRVDQKLAVFNKNCYHTMPVNLLKERTTETAFALRMKVGEFLYDQPEYEESLGPCDDRPLYNHSNGNVYLGQWIEGK